jgi:hypothetical protein
MNYFAMSFGTPLGVRNLLLCLRHELVDINRKADSSWLKAIRNDKAKNFGWLEARGSWLAATSSR